MIRLFAPYIAPDVPDRLREVFATRYIGEGPQVAAFEAALRAYLGVDVACVSSGTAALWLAYKLAGIQPGDRVVHPPLGCLASTETLLHFGARIVWADVDPATGMLDPDDVRKVIDGAKAVVAVDWGGSVCDMLALGRLCDEVGAVLIEDAAHSFGAHAFHTPHSLSQPAFSCFSFQAIKQLSTADGGAIMCQSPCDEARAKLLRWFGLDRTQGASMRCTQTVAEPGFKFQMHDVAATMGLASLKGTSEPLADVDNRIRLHRMHAAQYDEAFAGTAIRPLRRSPSSTAWLYSVVVPCARQFIHRMAALGVEVSQVHERNDKQPMFAASARRLPAMDELSETLVCLPVGWHLSENDVAHVIEAATRAVSEEWAA